ncbi:MAG: hypothetical protein LC118_06680 [Dehalococcoidia bacterium]|nr:hypothetical protein [Dehalococcoidia bacterium]
MRDIPALGAPLIKERARTSERSSGCISSTASTVYLPSRRVGEKKVVYHSMYGWRGDLARPLENPFVVNMIVFDFDSPILEYARVDTLMFVQTLMALYDVDPADLRIYFSGHKGFHVVLPIELFVGESDVTGLTPSAVRGTAMDLARGIASFDQSIYDLRRVIRIPNRQNMHSGLYKVGLAYEQLLAMNVDQIRSYAVQPRPHAPANEDTPTANRELGDILLRNVATSERTAGGMRDATPLPELFLPVKPGNRNNAATQLAGLLVKHIEDLQVLQQIMTTWNRTNPMPLHDRELASWCPHPLPKHPPKTENAHTHIHHPEFLT